MYVTFTPLPVRWAPAQQVSQIVIYSIAGVFVALSILLVVFNDPVINFIMPVAIKLHQYVHTLPLCANSCWLIKICRSPVGWLVRVAILLVPPIHPVRARSYVDGRLDFWFASRRCTDHVSWQSYVVWLLICNQKMLSHFQLAINITNRRATNYSYLRIDGRVLEFEVDPLNQE